MNRDDRGTKMLNLAALKFTAHDLALYLDTHPNDQKALDDFAKYTEEAQKAEEEFVAIYGPINVSQSASSTPFHWIKSPWPWEDMENGAAHWKGERF